MAFIITTANRGLFGSEVDEMHRQRKRVFVDHCSWKSPVVKDMEIDRSEQNDHLLAKAAPKTRAVRNRYALSRSPRWWLRRLS
jgi:N-acyl-L-homoserine lactone synthetase